MRSRVNQTLINGLIAGAVVVAFAAGCAAGDFEDSGAQPAAPSGSPGLSTPPVRSPGTRPPGTRSPAPGSTGFSDLTAVPCAGRPAVDEIVALLRRQGVVPGGATPTAVTGPMCAGTWQYTVLNLPDRDPFIAVTEGRPGGLRLITAGTNPCTAAVRGAAPPGILGAINCQA